MKSEFLPSHSTFSRREQNPLATTEAYTGSDDTEETYVPSSDKDKDDVLAPTGLNNPFWT